LVDAGDSGQQFDGEAKGLDLSVDLLIDVADRVDLLQMQAQQETVMPVTRPHNTSGGALIRRWANWASCSGSLSPWAFSPRV
jgi:hypothetical protein